MRPRCCRSYGATCAASVHERELLAVSLRLVSEGQTITVKSSQVGGVPGIYAAGMRGENVPGMIFTAAAFHSSWDPLKRISF